MRLWSLNPRYLDAKGLVALWREGLLARHALEGLTRGYRNHPQLTRFKALETPVAAIHQYLAAVLEEAQRRGYRFDASKINASDSSRIVIPVTSGQMAYEFSHLMRKLQQRAPEQWQVLQGQTLQGQGLQTIAPVEPHPSFAVIEGPIAEWEKQ
ncbi:MAG: DNA lyase [Vampirovibrionales bacterium]|nr:DNA lyase [Vampirovibrionales bacterium]